MKYFLPIFLVSLLILVFALAQCSSICVCFNINSKYSNVSAEYVAIKVDCESCEIKNEISFGHGSVWLQNCTALEIAIGLDKILNNQNSCTSDRSVENFNVTMVELFQKKFGINILYVSNYRSYALSTVPDEVLTLFKNLKSINYSKNFYPEVSSKVFRNSPNLLNLTLCDNNIQDLEHDLILSLVKLKYLDLSENSIESIPDNFFQNSQSLKYLKISKNHIKLQSMLKR